MAKRESMDATIMRNWLADKNAHVHQEIPTCARFRLWIGEDMPLEYDLATARELFGTLPDTVGLGDYVGKDTYLERIN